MNRVLLVLFTLACLYAIVILAATGKTGPRVDVVGAGDEQHYVKHCVTYRLWPPFDRTVGEPRATIAEAEAIPCPIRDWRIH